MKNRIAAILLAFSMLITASFTGCSGEEETSTETDKETVIIDNDLLKQYVVVRDEEADDVLVQCGMDVHSALKESGLSLKLTTDFYKEGVESFKINQYEILVGETNRDETAQFLDSLMPWQYGYALVGEKIVIAGHDSESTRAAVDCFIANITTRDTLYYSSADDYIHGEILEGVGREYTVATADGSELTADEISSLAAENEVLIIKNAAKGTKDSLVLPEGYACTDEISTGSACTLFIYNTEVFSFSSSGSLPMRKGTGLTTAQKGTVAYTVLRCSENLAKFVFAEATVPSGSADDCTNTVCSFLENCSPLPAIIYISTADGDRETVENKLTDVEYAEAYLLASEKTGESSDIFVSQTKIAVKSIDCADSEKIVFQKTEE